MIALLKEVVRSLWVCLECVSASFTFVTKPTPDYRYIRMMCFIHTPDNLDRGVAPW